MISAFLFITEVLVVLLLKKNINHICYADVICLIALSSSEMQQPLNICHTYSTEHSLLYNGNKSFSMCFKPSTIKFTTPWLFLAGIKILIVTHCKYLGVIVSEHNSDNDLKRQIKKFYANANMLIRKFSKCSVNIKCYLLKTYCSTMYCSALWFNSTKSALTKLKIAYNNSYVDYLVYQNYSSANEMFVNLGILSLGELLRKFVFSLKTRISVSHNSCLQSIYNSEIPLFSKIWAWWDIILTIKIFFFYHICVNLYSILYY